ncbi:MAG: metal-sulfur cluster assembly factor [Actinomycetota bacterium]
MDEQTIAGTPPASGAADSGAPEGIPATAGAEAVPASADAADGQTSADRGSADGPTRDAVLEALKNVYDPELGINIVDLGLVYEVDLSGGDVDITYSLTTMGCPIGPMIEDQMRAFVGKLEGVGEIRPEMVLRPAWSPEMMSDEAKAALGVF